MTQQGYTAQRAFHTSTQSGKAQTLAALSAVTPAWWKPDLIWASVPAALAWLGELLK